MKEKNKKYLTWKILLWVFTVSAFFIVIWLIFSAVLKISLISCDTGAMGSIKYTVSTPNKKGEYVGTTERVKASSYIRKGVVYFNFSEVAEKCDCSISGDDDSIRFIFEGGEVTFFYKSTLAYVASEPVILDGECFERNGDIYVPASFSEYMYSLSAEYSSRKLTVTFDPSSVRPANVGKVDKPVPVTGE